MGYEQPEEMRRYFLRVKYAEETVELYQGNKTGYPKEVCERQIKFHVDMAESHRRLLAGMGVTATQVADFETWYKGYKESRDKR